MMLYIHSPMCLHVIQTDIVTLVKLCQNAWKKLDVREWKVHWVSIVSYAEKKTRRQIQGQVSTLVLPSSVHSSPNYLPTHQWCVCGQINDIKRVLHLPQFTIYYSPFHKDTLTRIECLSPTKLCNFCDWQLNRCVIS